MWDIPQEIREHVEKSKQPKELMIDFFEESNSEVNYEEVSKKITTMKLKSKYFNLDQIEGLFRHIYDDFEAYLEKIESDLGKLDEENEGAFHQKLKNILTILDDLCDELYICYFRSFAQLVKIIEKSNDFDIKKIALSMCILLLGDNNMAAPVKESFLGGDGTMDSLSVLAFAFCNHVNAFGNTSYSLNDLLQMRKTNEDMFRYVYLDSQENYFGKIKLDLFEYRQDFENDYKGFLEKVRGDIEGKIMNKDFLESVMKVVDFRVKMIVVPKMDKHFWYKLVKLSLHSQILFHRNDKLAIKQHQKYAMKVFGVEKAPKKIEDVNQFQQLLKLPGDETYHGSILKSYLSSFSSNDDDLFEERTELLKKIISEISGEFVSRRSGSREGMMEEGKSSYQKSSKFMNDYFGILMHYVKQYFSKLDEQEIQDTCLFSEQILIFLDKSIEFQREEEMTEEKGGEGERLKIVLGYEPKVYTQAIRIISTEPNPPVRTLDEFIAILTKTLKSDEIYYVDADEATKKLDETEFNHLCSSLIKGINLLREDYMKSNFALNIQTYVTKLNEAEFWKYIFTREESNFVLKGNTLRVITDFFDEMPETSINSSITCFCENGVFSELWKFVVSCDKCDIQDFLYAMFLLTRVLINEDIEKEVKEMEFTKKICKNMFSYDYYKNTVLELRIQKPSNELYYSCAEAFIFHVNVNYNQSTLVVSEILKSLGNLLEIKAFFEQVESEGKVPEVVEDSPVNTLWGGVTQENLVQKRIIFDCLMIDASKFYVKLFNSHTTNLTSDLIKDSTFLEDSFKIYCHSGHTKWLEPVNYSYNLLKKIFALPGNGGVFKQFIKIIVGDLKEKLVELEKVAENFTDEDIEKAYRIFYGQKELVHLKENLPYKPFVLLLENCTYVSKLIQNLLMGRARVTGETLPELKENSEAFYTILNTHINFVIKKLNKTKTSVTKDIYFNALKSIPGELDGTGDITKALSKVETDDSKKCLTTSLNSLISRFYELVLAGNELESVRYMETLSQLTKIEYENEDKIKEMAIIMSSFSLLFHSIRSSLNMQNYIFCHQSGINRKFTEYTLAIYTILKEKYSKILELINHIDFNKKDEDSVKIGYEDLLAMRIISNNIQTILYPFARYVGFLDCKIRSGILKIDEKEVNKEEQIEYCRYVRLEIYEGFKGLLLGFCSHSPGEENIHVLPAEDEQDVKLIKNCSKFIVDYFNFGSFQKSLSKILKQLFKSVIKEGVEQPFNKSKGRNSRLSRKNKLITLNKEKLLELGFPLGRIELAIDAVANPFILEELFEWLLANPQDSPSKDKVEEKEDIKEGEMQEEEVQGMEEEDNGLLEIKKIDTKEGSEILTESFRSLCNECFKSVLFLRSEFDFGKLLSNFFKLTKGNKKFEKVFVFELYYIYLDTFMLILNSLAKTRLQSKGYLNDFKVIIPSNIIRKKENWGVDNSVSLKVKCREYNRIKDPKRRVSYLLKDANSLLRSIIKILNFAGSRNWSPSCSSELNYLLSFLNELVNLANSVMKDGEKNDMYTVNINLSDVLQTTFELILKIMRMEPKANKDNKLSKMINEKSKENLKEVKISVCKNLIKNSRVFLKTHEKVYKKFNLKIINRKNLAGLLKMLAECLRQSDDIKKSFLKKNYLKSLMRLDIKLKAENKSLISSIKEILMELIVDKPLIEASMESEIRYFFYAHEKKKRFENRKEKRKEGPDGKAKELDYKGVSLQKYLKVFKKISAAHPETFVNLNSKLCCISVKGVKDLKKLKKTNKAKYKHMKKQNSMVRCKENQSLAHYQGADLKGISYNTTKATILIINEIIISWIRKFESRMEVIDDNCDRTFPKLITSIFVDQILARLPLLGLIIRRYNCIEVVKKNAKSRFILDRIEGMSKMSFISFLVKVVVFSKPKEFRHLWTFINNSTVLIKVNDKIRPLSHEFRANLIREINACGKNIGGKIKGLIELDGSSNNIEQEFASIMEVRAYSTLLMEISKHFNCLRAIIGKKFDKIISNDLNKILIEILSNTSPEKISRFKKVFKFAFSSLSLLYKYSALLALNKSGVDEVTEFKYVGSLEAIQNKNILQIQSPHTLLLNWAKVSTSTSYLSPEESGYKSFKFKNPKVVLSSSNEPIKKDRDSKANRVFDYRNRDEDEYIEVGELTDPDLYENGYFEEEMYEYEYQDDYYNSEAYLEEINDEEYIEDLRNDGWDSDERDNEEYFRERQIADGEMEEEGFDFNVEEELSNDYYNSGNMMIDHLSNDRGDIEEDDEPTEYVITSADITGRLRESENRVNTEVRYVKPVHRYPYEGRKEFLSKVLNPFIFDEQRDHMEKELMNEFDKFCDKFSVIEKYSKLIKVIRSGESRHKKSQRLNKMRRDLLIERFGPELFNDLANMNENVQDILGGLIRLDGERVVTSNFFDNLMMDFQVLNDGTPERPARLENMPFVMRQRPAQVPNVNMFETNERLAPAGFNEQEVQNMLMSELEVLEEEDEEQNEIQENPGDESIGRESVDSERYTPLVESQTDSNINSTIAVNSSGIHSLIASAFGSSTRNNQNGASNINPFDNIGGPIGNPFGQISQMFNTPANEQPRDGNQPDENNETPESTQNPESQETELQTIEENNPTNEVEEHGDRPQEEDQDDLEDDEDSIVQIEDMPLNIQEGEGEDTVEGEQLAADNADDNTEELTIEVNEGPHEVVQNHNAQMPSHCSPAPELITFSNQSRNETSTPNQNHGGQTEIEPVAEENNETSDIQENQPDAGANEQTDANPNPPAPVINFDFSALGLPANFLELNGIDRQFFSELPYELQMEVIFQNMTRGNTYQNFGETNPPTPTSTQNETPAPAENTEQQAGQDQGEEPNTTNPAPQQQDNQIQPPSNQSPADVLSQPQATPPQPNNTQHNTSNNTQANSPRRNNLPNPEPANENLSFLNSLTPELRNEVLLTCPEDFLQGLPAEAQEEAARLRERVIASEMARQRVVLNRGRYLNPDQIRAQLSSVERQKLALKKQAEKAKNRLDPKIAKKVNIIDDKAIAGLIRLLLTSQRVEDFEFELVAACCMNPETEQKLIGALVFLLTNPEVFKFNDSTLIEGKIYNNGFSVFSGEKMEKKYLNSILKILESLSFSHQEFLLDLLKGNPPIYILEEVKLLLRDNETFKTGTLEDILELFSRKIFYKKQSNVTLALKLILNVIKHSISTDESKELICDFLLKRENVNKLCLLLNNKSIKEDAFSILGDIISHLCFSQENLVNFIQELTQTIINLSKNLNSKMKLDIEMLKSCIENPTKETKEMIEFLIIKRQNEVNSDELRLYKMFKMILKLYEKSLEQHKDDKTKGDQNATKEKINREVRAKFTSLTQNENLRNLWLNICEGINYLETLFHDSKKVMKPAIHEMKPLIESFFIMYKILCDDEMIEKIKRIYKSKSKNMKISALKMTSEEKMGEVLLKLSFEELRKQEMGIKELLLVMCEKNRKVLNTMIKQNISLLTGSLSVLPKKMPSILDFENKREYFKSMIDVRRNYHRLNLIVRRNQIFSDSYNQIISKTPNELRSKLHIEFKGEEGEDAGGVSREWFNLLSKDIFYADYALFIPSANGATYQPSPHSHYNPDHIRYFKFIGRVIGKALFDGFFMDSFFTRSFYKHMTGSPLTYEDIEDIDPDYFKNLQWILNNDISDMGLTFICERDNFGKVERKPLKPNGENIEVTNENKEEYVNLICYEKMANTIKSQIESFLEGLHELIPKDLLAIFDARELELMISGLPEINIDDLRQNTQYTNYTKDSRSIRWFWEILSSFDREEKANFLQYVTGTSKVPVEGFKALKGIRGLQPFQIHKAFDTKLLPTSHTCMNQLDLPDYQTKEEMKEKLQTAINWGKEGFGFL